MARDRLRRRTRQPEVVPLELSVAGDDEDSWALLIDPAGVPGESLLTEERFMELNACLADLPEKLRTPLVPVAFGDQSYAEIAALLNCSLKTVEMRLCHARERLRTQQGRLFPRP